MAGFKKATKKAKNLVISFQGASGSGKTYSALNVAKYLCPPGKRVAFIDTENSAELYADSFDFDLDDDFGPFGKLNYGPKEWMKKLHAARDAKQYGVVVLDSLTHLWKGPGGILAQLDDDAAAYKAKWNKYADTNALWKKYTPIYDAFMNDLRHLDMHVIFCLRAKEKTDRKQNDKGKIEITKLGLEAEYRDGFAYDIDAQILIDEDHIAVAKKHRLQDFLNGKVFELPGKNLADALLAALAAGVTDEPTPAAAPISPAQAGALADAVEKHLDPKQMAKDFQSEEPSPDTNRNPPTERVVPTAPTSSPELTPAQVLLARLQAAVTEADLKSAAAEIKAALKDRLISPEVYNQELSPAYAKRQKEIRQQAA